LRLFVSVSVQGKPTSFGDASTDLGWLETMGEVDEDFNVASTATILIVTLAKEGRRCFITGDTLSPLIVASSSTISYS